MIRYVVQVSSESSKAKKGLSPPMVTYTGIAEQEEVTVWSLGKQFLALRETFLSRKMIAT